MMRTSVVVVVAAGLLCVPGCSDPATSRLAPGSEVVTYNDFPVPSLDHPDEPERPSTVVGIDLESGGSSIYPVVSVGVRAIVAYDGEPDGEDDKGRSVTVRFLDGEYAGKVGRIARSNLRPAR